MKNKCGNKRGRMEDFSGFICLWCEAVWYLTQWHEKEIKLNILWIEGNITLYAVVK